MDATISSTSSLRTRASNVALTRSVSSASGAYLLDVRTRVPSGSPVAAELEEPSAYLPLRQSVVWMRYRLTIQVGVALKVDIPIAGAVVSGRGFEDLV